MTATALRALGGGTRARDGAPIGDDHLAGVTHLLAPGIAMAGEALVDGRASATLEAMVRA